MSAALKEQEAKPELVLREPNAKLNHLAKRLTALGFALALTLALVVSGLRSSQSISTDLSNFTNSSTASTDHFQTEAQPLRATFGPGWISLHMPWPTRPAVSVSSFGDGLQVTVRWWYLAFWGLLVWLASSFLARGASAIVERLAGLPRLLICGAAVIVIAGLGSLFWHKRNFGYGFALPDVLQEVKDFQSVDRVVALKIVRAQNKQFMVTAMKPEPVPSPGPKMIVSNQIPLEDPKRLLYALALRTSLPNTTSVDLENTPQVFSALAMPAVPIYWPYGFVTRTNAYGYLVLGKDQHGDPISVISLVSPQNYAGKSRYYEMGLRYDRSTNCFAVTSHTFFDGIGEQFDPNSLRKVAIITTLLALLGYSMICLCYYFVIAWRKVAVDSIL